MWPGWCVKWSTPINSRLAGDVNVAWGHLELQSTHKLLYTCTHSLLAFVLIPHWVSIAVIFFLERLFQGLWHPPFSYTTCSHVIVVVVMFCNAMTFSIFDCKFSAIAHIPSDFYVFVTLLYPVIGWWCNLGVVATAAAAAAAAAAAVVAIVVVVICRRYLSSSSLLFFMTACTAFTSSCCSLRARRVC